MKSAAGGFGAEGGISLASSRRGAGAAGGGAGAAAAGVWNQLWRQEAQRT
jgi:hypothetical protein